MSERQLYRLVAGKQTGPYPPEKLRPLVADGRISRLDRFSYDGVDWLPADQFPELMGKSPTVSPALPSSPAAAALPPEPQPAGVPALPPPPGPPAGVTQVSVSSRVPRLPLLAGVGAVGAILLVAGVVFGLKGNFIGASGLNDVTDRFDAIVKSTEGFDGKRVCVRGTYFPQELAPRPSGRDYTIKFRSAGTKRAVVSGDRENRLTLVVPQAMGNRLMQIVGRLESEQPAMLDIVCSNKDDGGEKRPIGRVARIMFCREAPMSASVKAFLKMDEDGEIEEE
jgi:hypothetical protein